METYENLAVDAQQKVRFFVVLFLALKDRCLWLRWDSGHQTSLEGYATFYHGLRCLGAPRRHRGCRVAASGAAPAGPVPRAREEPKEAP